MNTKVVLVAAVVAGCQGSQGAVLPSAPRPPLATTLVKQIDVTPSKQVLAPGHTVQLMAAVYMLDGQITANVHWYSSDDTVATVDSRTGLVTAIKEGLVTITARSALEPKRLGLCTLLVSTCASCSVPMAPRVDMGAAVTEEEQSALQAVLQPYRLEVVDSDVSYVLNEKGKIPERVNMAENKSLADFPSKFPAVVTTPRTTWLSSYVAAGTKAKLTEAGHFTQSLFPYEENLDISLTRNLPCRVLFYKWDGSWVKDMEVVSGRRLFIDDLPVGAGLIGRIVVQKFPRVYEAWTKPFVLTTNRVSTSNSQLHYIPQLDFALDLGTAY